LCALAIWLGGCIYDITDSGQAGETEAEGRRRHIRNARINQQEMMEDVDRALMYDEPSGLTDKKIP